MHLYRTDRAALIRLVALEDETDSDAPVLHPPNVTQSFSDPSALATAYQRRRWCHCPTNRARSGWQVDPAWARTPARSAPPPPLYRGLRPDALRTLIVMAARVRSLSGGAAPLRIASTVSDAQLPAQHRASVFAAAANGYSFQIERRYVPRAQAEALQAMLDRLQSLNLIAWAREPTVDRRHRRRRTPHAGCGRLARVTDASAPRTSCSRACPDFPFAPHWRDSTVCAWPTSTRATARRSSSCTASRPGRFCGARCSVPVRDAGFRCIAPDLPGLRPLRQADRFRLVHLRPSHRGVRGAARRARPARQPPSSSTTGAVRSASAPPSSTRSASAGS